MSAPADPQAPCIICSQTGTVIHSHHVVPQSRGGQDSLQIALCPTCHNAIHANAVFLVSQIRRNVIRKSKKFWRSPEEELRASKFLEILVRALLSPILAERKHLLSTSVSTSVFEEFKLLQLDIGASSMEKTLHYCIQSALNNKGISNVSRTVQKESSMWFLHKPAS